MESNLVLKEEYNKNNLSYQNLLSNAVWSIENRGNFVVFSEGVIVGEGFNMKSLLSLISQQRNPDRCYIAQVGTDTTLTRVSDLENLD